MIPGISIDLDVLFQLIFAYASGARADGRYVYEKTLGGRLIPPCQEFGRVDGLENSN